MEAHAERCEKLLEQLPSDRKSSVAASVRRYIHTVKILAKSERENVFVYGGPKDADELDEQYHALETNIGKIGLSNPKVVQEALDELYGRIRAGIIESSAAEKAKEVFEKKHQRLRTKDKKLYEQEDDAAVRKAMLWEAMVMWVATFGERESVTFDEWWEAMCEHLTIYGFYKTSIKSSPFIEAAIKLAFPDSNTIKIRDFREYLLRFGPFDKALKRTAPLTTDFASQQQSVTFLATKDANAVDAHLKSHKTHKYVVRFGSGPGTLTFDKGKVLKTKYRLVCSPSGYTVSLSADKGGVTKPCENVLQTLQHFPGVAYSAVRSNILKWEANIDAFYQDAAAHGDYVDLNETNLKIANENKSAFELHQEMIARVGDVGAKVDNLRDEFRQVSLRLLTNLDSTMPRQFILVPNAEEKDGNANVEKGLTSFLSKCKKRVKDAFVSSWTVHVLCEGNLRGGPDADEQKDSSRLGAHFTSHEGYKITLPKDALLKALPYIRVGLKLASVAASAAAGGIVNIGPLCDILDSYDMAGKFEAISDRLGEAECALSDVREATKLPNEQEQIIEDYQQLRALLGDKIPQNELAKGEFGGLTLMLDHKGIPVWVCDRPECCVGLTKQETRSADPLAQGPVGTPGAPGGGLPASQSVEVHIEDADASSPAPRASSLGAKPRPRPHHLKRSSTTDSAEANDVGAGFPPSPGGTMPGMKNLQSTTPTHDRQISSLSKGNLTVKVLGARDLWNADAKIFNKFGLSKRDVSDPFVEVEVRDISEANLRTVSTNVVKDNLNPDWDEKFEWTVRRDIDEITFNVYDHENKGDPQFLGMHVVNVDRGTEFHFDSANPSDGNLKLRPRPGQKKNRDKITGYLMVKIDYVAPLE